jgi:hypothetical protein
MVGRDGAWCRPIGSDHIILRKRTGGREVQPNFVQFLSVFTVEGVEVSILFSASIVKTK